METFITLPYAFERPAPSFGDSDIRFPESLVRYWLETLTKPGAKILDPFAGLGTTLFVAEEMGRVPYGTEAERERFEWTAGQLQHWNHLIHTDAAKIASCGFPKMDFCLTSPPFMAANEKWNPLSSGNPAKAGYATYLKQLDKIFAELPKVMKRGAYVVVQVDNIQGKVFTPLVRDLGSVIAKSFKPIGETIVAWDGSPMEYAHTHCLIFRA